MKVAELKGDQTVDVVFMGKSCKAKVVGTGRCNGSPVFGDVDLIDDDGHDHSDHHDVAVLAGGQ